jgi:opacity protein-like surface antigen
MKFLLASLILLGINASAQVDMSEKEKLEQQREVNRKEDALRNEALKANEKSSTQPRFNIEDTGAQFDVDHSTFSYTSLSEKDNLATGIKFSGAFCASILNETQEKKNIRIMVGVELPFEADLPSYKLVPFAGGGLQIGSGLSLYGNIGLDYRLAKWFKIQAGANFDTQHNFGAIVGAGLTW